MAMLIQVVFLITNTLALFFTILLLLRFFMQVFRVPFHNRGGEFVLHLTNWLVLPLRKIIPPVSQFDMASLVAAYLLQILLLAIVVALTPSSSIIDTHTIIRILINGLKSLLRTGLYLFALLLFVQAILSWFKPEALPLINQLTAPLLRPLRRIIPPIANVDLTPLIALLLVQIILLFL